MKIIKVESCISCKNFRRDYDVYPRVNYCIEYGLIIPNNEIERTHIDCQLENYKIEEIKELCKPNPKSTNPLTDGFAREILDIINQ